MSGPPALTLRSSFGSSGTGSALPSMPPARSRSSDRVSAAQQRHARAAVSFTSLAQSYAQIRDVLDNPNEHNITPQEMVTDRHSAAAEPIVECARQHSTTLSPRLIVAVSAVFRALPGRPARLLVPAIAGDVAQLSSAQPQIDGGARIRQSAQRVRSSNHSERRRSCSRAHTAA